MSDTGFASQVTALQLQALLSDSAPPAEGVSGAAGVTEKASRDSHQHPRLSSAMVATLNASGEATIPFSRTFAATPAVVCLLIETADAQPIIFKVKSWAQDGSNNYTGCVIKGYRLNTLPASLTLLTALVNFNIANGSAAGAQFCCVALQASM